MRAREKDRNTCAKTKKLLNFLRLDEKRPFSVAKLIFNHFYALAANQFNKEELVKNAFFFAIRWPSPKG